MVSVTDFVDDNCSYVDEFNYKGRYFGMFSDSKKGKFEFFDLNNERYFYDDKIGNRFHTSFWHFIGMCIIKELVNVKEGHDGRKYLSVRDLYDAFRTMIESCFGNKNVYRSFLKFESKGLTFSRSELTCFMFSYKFDDHELVTKKMIDGNKKVFCCHICNNNSYSMLFRDGDFYRSWYTPSIIKCLKPSEAYFSVDHYGNLFSQNCFMHHYRQRYEHFHYRMGVDNIDIESIVVLLSCLYNIRTSKNHVYKLATRCFYPYETWLYLIESSEYFVKASSLYIDFLNISDVKEVINKYNQIFLDYDSIYNYLVSDEDVCEKQEFKSCLAVLDDLRSYLKNNGCECPDCSSVMFKKEEHIIALCKCHSCIWYRQKRGIIYKKNTKGLTCTCIVCVGNCFYGL